jgi:hypothetical protein
LTCLFRWRLDLKDYAYSGGYSVERIIKRRNQALNVLAI